MLVELGSPSGLRGVLAELHRCRDQLEGITGRGHARLDVAIGYGLNVGGRLQGVLHYGPLPYEAFEPIPPLRKDAPQNKYVGWLALE